MNKLVLIAGAAFALTACNAPKEQKVETKPEPQPENAFPTLS